MNAPSFEPLAQCWVCQGTEWKPGFPAHFRLTQYAQQDPELAAYSGSQVAVQRCVRCGFMQPEALPGLPNFFDRMYDQQWSLEWVEREFESRYKDFIFHGILNALGRRAAHLADEDKTLLDIGAHAGRFLHLAQLAGWRPEGIELNPRTAAYAAQRTGLPVHRVNAETLAADNRRYAAITLTDVLEHIPNPLNILRTAAGLLRPGGWTAIKVPCAPSQVFKERLLAPWRRNGVGEELANNLVHVNHFSPGSLRLALERCGFQRVTITVGAPELSDLRFQPGWKSRASNGLRRAVYWAASGLPGGLHTPLALHLQAYAQKGEAASAREARARINPIVMRSR